MLDTLLNDYLPVKYRRWVHALILLGAVIYGAWEASDGDWRKMIAAIAVGLYAAANKANAVAPDHNVDTGDEPGVVESEDDAALAADYGVSGNQAALPFSI